MRRDRRKCTSYCSPVCFIHILQAFKCASRPAVAVAHSSDRRVICADAAALRPRQDDSFFLRPNFILRSRFWPRRRDARTAVSRTPLSFVAAACIKICLVAAKRAAFGREKRAGKTAEKEKENEEKNVELETCSHCSFEMK